MRTFPVSNGSVGVKVPPRIFTDYAPDSRFIRELERDTKRAEDDQGTPTQSHISPSILVYEEIPLRLSKRVFYEKVDGSLVWPRMASLVMGFFCFAFDSV